MLPQVASHIFHHTSRAVAAAQNQAGHTLRNVLGFQTSTNPSSTSSLASWNNSTGSSSYGNGHAGAGGGAKFHPGSRFYSGYRQPSRSVAQANTSSTDTGVTYQDDADESGPTLPQTVTQSTHVARKQRSRSQSFSLGSDAIATAERAKSFGVLRAVQQHARLHHAFVGLNRPQRVLEDAETASRPPTPRLVRRNSTASTVSVASLPDDISLSPRPVPSVDPTDLAHPQSVLAPELRPKSPLHPRPRTSAATTDLQLLDPFEVRAELLTLRQPNCESTVDDWNDVLDKLAAIRKLNEQPTEILQTYNDMVTRSIQPNARTYTTLINVLTARDNEVYWITLEISNRIKKRDALGLSGHAENFVDQRRLEALRGEQNFPSALRLFSAASASRKYVLPGHLYISLLSSCARHQNVKAAIRLFSHLEKRGYPKPYASIYAQLLDVYMSVNDIEGARVVFDEFRKNCSHGQITWDQSNLSSARAGHIRVWNSMINAYLRAANPGAALDLLGEMLDTEAGIEFGPKDVPAPAMSTYIVIVRGFCLMGDPASAVSWFERLVDQGKHTKDEWTPTLEPPQPTVEFWRHILNQLHELDRVDDINRLYARYAAHLHNPGQIPIFMRRIVYFANIRYLQAHEVSVEQAVALLDQALSALGPRKIWGTVFRDINGFEATRELIGMYTRFGNIDKAIDVIEQLSASTDGITWPVKAPHGPLADQNTDTIQLVSDIVLFDNDVLRPLPLSSVLRIVKAWAARGMHVTQRLAQAVLSAYILAEERQDQLTELIAQDWEALAFSVGTYGDPTTKDGNVSLALSLLTDMARFSIDPGHISEAVMHKLLRLVIDQKGIAETTALMRNLGPGFSALLDSPKAFAYFQPAGLPSPQPTPNAAAIEVETMKIDDYHGRYIDELDMNKGKDDTAVTAFRRFERGAALGTFPSLEVVGRLIEGLGRAGETAKVDYLYGVAQNIISLLHETETAQLDGWAAVENSMIIARGHAGDGLSADAHRLRLLQQGLTPTADAYGALIQCVKDTTDDTARALEYFHESQARGVHPNIFLYNTTISKLAKARKADYALELFHKMKSSGIVPSSITYGAVIAACCRVGDSVSAETLFDEMTAQRNFRPRVPPYNTMMQFYVQTKPNRARFLHYYNRMISAGIKPTAHSYKLLLDCYGTIAPIDIKTMEKTFAQLVSDKSVTVQGSHWAALINAHGCVGKDIDKAIDVFNSIEKHASTLKSRARLPDAVAFEALINVFVTLRQTDLVSSYLERLQQSGVRMTAYIANLLIRGYAAAGNIEEARKVFESLADPPVGVAAPHNHAPHDSSVPPRISTNELVYREPSTWEAMVRAELGNGNRDHAISLIRRVQERQYPDSIVNRISGIMVDDAASPWSSTPSSEVDNSASPGPHRS